MDDEPIPAWATGQDCFESDAQRQEVESNRGRLADYFTDAYCLGDLHALANALETFQQSHRLRLTTCRSVMIGFRRVTK